MTTTTTDPTAQSPSEPGAPPATTPPPPPDAGAPFVPPIMPLPRRTARDRWQDLRAEGPLMMLSWAGFLSLLVAAVIQRWWFIFRMHDPKNFVWSDMAGYVDRGWRLAAPNITLNRFDTFYPPGTHILMAPLFRLAGSKEKGMEYNQWLWWVLAFVTVWAVGFIALRLFRHPLAGALAMLGLMLHWPFTIFTGFFMSESPFACFMALSLLVGLIAYDMDPARPWRRAGVYAVAGLIAGMAATIRPQFAIGAMFIGVPLLSLRFPFVRIREAVALALMFILPCVGAMRLNSHAAGIKMGMSGNAGFNFYQGHCDVVHVETHEKGGGSWYAFAAPVRIQRVNNEGKPEKKVVIKGHMAWENDYFFDEGFKCIREEGWKHLERIYTNVEDLFAPADPWPPNSGRFAKISNWANKSYSHGLLFLLPFVVFLARYRRPERWLLIQLATVLPVGFLFYGDSRYRVPYDMFGFIMLAGVIVAILGMRRDERWVPSVGWRKRARSVG
ncbi:MAG: hypothetical protein AB2A00_21585 [Myxococcota bacterium]